MSHFMVAAGRRCAVGMLGALLVAMGGAPAWGYLGSFSQNDGYELWSNTIWGDVSLYNAGQYGPNAGGGSYTQLFADTGLWKLQGNVGGYFDNPTDRSNAVFAGPLYLFNPPNTQPAYVVGDHSPGHLDQSALALRNATPLGTGPMVYDYTLDNYDFGGVSPATITSGTIQTGFFFCPNPELPPQSGTRVGEKFTLSLVDSVGNIGLQWGYARDNEVLWRDGPASPWTNTGIYANAGAWDEVQLVTDLTNDTFGIDYYSTLSNTWSTLAPLGTPMGQAMGDLTHLGWRLEDGIFSGVGGKNFFDDFSFVVPVPEPSSWVLATAGLVAIGWAQRIRR